MAIKDFLHPIWRSALTKYGKQENIDFLTALQQPLDDTKEDILNNKLQLYLSTAQAHWLDYWGSWLGLRRYKSEADDDFRIRMINHVLHARNTTESIRDAIADFINTQKDNIYIYEPFRDMLYWNSGDTYNSLKYFPSSYYNYAIIDVRIDAAFPPEVVEIINLFRPAGVIWTLTDDINGVSPDANIIDCSIGNSNLIEDDFYQYAGWYQIETYRLTTSYNDNPISGTAFTWNESYWNKGNIYYHGDNKFDTIATVGQLYQDYVPLDSDEYNDTRVYSDQRNIDDNATLSNLGSTGVAFNLQPSKDNLINNSAVGTNLIIQSDLKSGDLNRADGGVTNSNRDFHSDNYIATNGETIFTFSSPDYAFKGASNHTLAMYDSDKNYLGYQSIYSATQTLSKSNVAYIRFSINFVDEGGTFGNLSDWLETHRYKLEKGSVATAWIPNSSDGSLQSNYSGSISSTTSNSSWAGIDYSSLKPSSQYQIGLKGYSSDNFTNTSIYFNLVSKDGSTNQVVLKKDPNTSPTWYTGLLKTTSTFDPTGTCYIQASGSDTTYDFSYSDLTVRDYNDLVPLGFSLNSESNYSLQGLTAIYDVNGFLTRFTDHSTSQLSPNYINSIFSIKNLVVTLKAPTSAKGINLSPYVYNFNLNMWVEFDVWNVNNNYETFNINFPDISMYLNSNCLMFIKFIPANIVPISVNYIGLTLSNPYNSSNAVLASNQADFSIVTE